MGWNRIGVSTEVQGNIDTVQNCEILDGGVLEALQNWRWKRER
jgi:hypothetical protein